MHCAEPLRHLGAVDISDLAAALALQPQALWDADAEFRRALAPYRMTRTIYLKMTLGGPDATARLLSGWRPLRSAFEPIAEAIGRLFPRPGRVLNAQIALLPPGGSIAAHRDRGPTLEASHRVHVPITTHPDVDFIVEQQRLVLAVGQAYELDNMRIHAVTNRSPIDRIHLIVDYFEEPAASPDTLRSLSVPPASP